MERTAETTLPAGITKQQGKVQHVQQLISYLEPNYSSEVQASLEALMDLLLAVAPVTFHGAQFLDKLEPHAHAGYLDQHQLLQVQLLTFVHDHIVPVAENVRKLVAKLQPPAPPADWMLAAASLTAEYTRQKQNALLRKLRGIPSNSVKRQTASADNPPPPLQPAALLHHAQAPPQDRLSAFVSDKGVHAAEQAQVPVDPRETQPGTMVKRKEELLAQKSAVLPQPQPWQLAVGLTGDVDGAQPAVSRPSRRPPILQPQRLAGQSTGPARPQRSSKDGSPVLSPAELHVLQLRDAAAQKAGAELLLQAAAAMHDTDPVEAVAPAPKGAAVGPVQPSSRSREVSSLLPPWPDAAQQLPSSRPARIAKETEAKFSEKKLAASSQPSTSADTLAMLHKTHDSEDFVAGGMTDVDNLPERPNGRPPPRMSTLATAASRAALPAKPAFSNASEHRAATKISNAVLRLGKGTVAALAPAALSASSYPMQLQYEVDGRRCTNIFNIKLSPLASRNQYSVLGLTYTDLNGKYLRGWRWLPGGVLLLVASSTDSTPLPLPEPWEGEEAKNASAAPAAPAADAPPPASPHLVAGPAPPISQQPAQTQSDKHHVVSILPTTAAIADPFNAALEAFNKFLGPTGGTAQQSDTAHLAKLKTEQSATSPELSLAQLAPPANDSKACIPGHSTPAMPSPPSTRAPARSGSKRKSEEPPPASTSDKRPRNQESPPDAPNLPYTVLYDRDGNRYSPEPGRHFTHGQQVHGCPGTDQRQQMLYSDPQRSKQVTKVCHVCQRQTLYAQECSTCKKNVYCNWCRMRFSTLSASECLERCAACSGLCTCKSCLRREPAVQQPQYDPELWQRTSDYLLHQAGPWVAEWLSAEDEEADADSSPNYVVPPPVYEDMAQQRVVCNQCCTSIPNVHRRCTDCEWDVCVECCKTLRFQNQGVLRCPNPSCTSHVKLEHDTRLPPGVPQASIGSSGADVDGQGLGPQSLQLRRFFDDNWMRMLRLIAQEYGSADSPPPLWSWPGMAPPPPAPPGDPPAGHVRLYGYFVRLEDVRLASRKGHPHYLFTPYADTLQPGHARFALHFAVFQSALRERDPVVVRGVRSQFWHGWTPDVLSRAVRDLGNQKAGTAKELDIEVTDCADGMASITMPITRFWEAYKAGYDHLEGSSKRMLKLKDYPPQEGFKNKLVRHNQDFLSMLPLPVYCHPLQAPLNMAGSMPAFSNPTDLGPKTYIALGTQAEQHAGEERDSCTKCHQDMSDAVNVLVHTGGDAPEEVRWGHTPVDPSGSYGNAGAVWDIWRSGEDSHKLRAYLRSHHTEFVHHGQRVQVGFKDPVFEQAFMLTREHHDRLYQEYQVESWHFEQYLHEAVFIPAGCPHQVRNLRSCAKVAVDFMPPEALREALAMRHQLRQCAEPSERPYEALHQDKLQGPLIVLSACVDAYTRLRPDAARQLHPAVLPPNSGKKQEAKSS